MDATTIGVWIAALVYIGLFVGFVSAFALVIVGMAVSGKWHRHIYKELTCEPRDLMKEITDWVDMGFRVIGVYESEASGNRVKAVMEKRVFTPLAWT